MSSPELTYCRRGVCVCVCVCVWGGGGGGGIKRKEVGSPDPVDGSVESHLNKSIVGPLGPVNCSRVALLTATQKELIIGGEEEMALNGGCYAGLGMLPSTAALASIPCIGGLYPTPSGQALSASDTGHSSVE
jgi:hypothetical protein